MNWGELRLAKNPSDANLCGFPLFRPTPTRRMCVKELALKSLLSCKDSKESVSCAVFPALCLRYHLLLDYQVPPNRACCLFPFLKKRETGKHCLLYLCMRMLGKTVEKWVSKGVDVLVWGEWVEIAEGRGQDQEKRVRREEEPLGAEDAKGKTRKHQWPLLAICCWALNNNLTRRSVNR